MSLDLEALDRRVDLTHGIQQAAGERLLEAIRHDPAAQAAMPARLRTRLEHYLKMSAAYYAAEEAAQAAAKAERDDDGERPVAGQMAAKESNDWVAASLPSALRGGVL